MRPINSCQVNACVWVLSSSIVFDSLQSHGLYPDRLLCPRNSPGKNTGVGCHFLLQGIFPTQGSNPSPLHCRQIRYRLSHLGSPIYSTESGKRYKATLLAHCPPPPRACSTSTPLARTKHQPQPHTRDGLWTQGPFCFIIINVFIVNVHTHSILTATPQAMSFV